MDTEVYTDVFFSVFLAYSQINGYDQACGSKEPVRDNKRAGVLPASTTPAQTTAQKRNSSVLSKEMITLIRNESKQEFTQEVYNDLTEKLPLWQIKCSCGQAGYLVRHAYYSRKLKRRKKTISLCVLRVKCKYCGRTHAILTDDIVPYEQVALDIQIDMIQLKMWSEEMKDLLKDNLKITESDVAAVKRRYKKHWKERLAAMGKELTDDLNVLIQAAFSFFHRQFMQIKRGVNLTFIPEPLMLT